MTRRISFHTLRRVTAAIMLGIFIVSDAAFALTSREAAAVVDVIERLQPSFGRFAYDEDIAEEWFTRDADEDRAIAKAGFSEDRWKTAVRETVGGFLAALSDAELQGIFSSLKQGIEKIKQLNAAQKKEVLQAVDEQIQVILVMRKEGRAFADTVRPLVPRIRTLLLDSNKR